MDALSRVSPRTVQLVSSGGWLRHFKASGPLPDLGALVRVTGLNSYGTRTVTGTFAGLTHHHFFLKVRPTPTTQVEFDPCADPQVQMEVLN